MYSNLFPIFEEVSKRMIKFKRQKNKLTRKEKKSEKIKNKKILSLGLGVGINQILGFVICTDNFGF